MAGDPFWNQVIFATHGGEDAGWADVKNAVWPTFGPSIFSITSSQKVFGNNSFSLWSSLNAWVQWDVDPTPTFGTQDFTIELWVRTNVVNGLFLRCKGVKIYIDNGNLFVRVGSTTMYPGAAARIINEGWKHIAVERYGANLTVYFGGVQVAQANIGASDISGQDWPYVTLNGYASGSEAGAGGYIDDCRVTMGVARYKGAFSVPTETFPDYYEPPASSIIYWD